MSLVTVLTIWRGMGMGRGIAFGKATQWGLELEFNVFFFRRDLFFGTSQLGLVVKEEQWEKVGIDGISPNTAT